MTMSSLLALPMPMSPVGRSMCDTKRQRGDLTRQLVLGRGNYVQQVHGVPVRTWANGMVPSLVQADSTNFRAAMKRDTFEGAM